MVLGQWLTLPARCGRHLRRCNRPLIALAGVAACLGAALFQGGRALVYGRRIDRFKLQRLRPRDRRRNHRHHNHTDSKCVHLTFRAGLTLQSKVRGGRVSLHILGLSIESLAGTLTPHGVPPPRTTPSRRLCPSQNGRNLHTECRGHRTRRPAPQPPPQQPYRQQMCSSTVYFIGFSRLYHPSYKREIL